MQYQDRPYQDDCEKAIFDYFINGGLGNPLCALPTGTGKSLVIAKLIKRIMQLWPSQRILCLTHVKELIRQNSDKLKDIWPSVPLGIYSAGLKQKELNWPITFGGVASVVKIIGELGRVDLLIIDEAHLLSDKSDSMYGFIIDTLKKVNPSLRVIGFTATPYRQGLGLLTDGGIFTDIVYDITGYKAFNKLIEDGYLSPPVTKKTTTKLDLSNVGVSNGDFNATQLEQVVDKQDTNYLACKEMVEYGFDRNSWLIFAAGLKHAEHISEMLNSFGISTKAIHSKMGDEARDTAIRDFKSGKLRCVVNNNVLTTGFDHPPIDFIGMLRPTMSTGLWVQMLGRGTRPSPETMKQNCLCLDFAGNTVRLGPINDPVIPRKKSASGAPGVPPIKICDQCGTYNHATAVVCSTCGFEFPRSINITKTAGTEELLRSDMPVIEWFDVQRVVYGKMVSKGENYLKATYVIPRHKKAYHEIVCLEKSGGLGAKARKWWMLRMGVDQAPPTVDEALNWTHLLMMPKRVQIHINKQFPEITGYEF